MEEGMVMQKTQLKRKLLVVVHVCSRKTCVELGAGWSLSILKHTRKHTHTHTHTQDSRLLQGRRRVQDHLCPNGSLVFQREVM